MKTDKELYKIFVTYPQLLFEMAGLQPDDHYEMVSITLKGFERRSDGFFIPQSEKSPVYFLEFQAYHDQVIYHRTIMEMAAYGIQNPGREIRGIIIFTYKGLDKKTMPWHELTFSNKHVFKVIYLEDYLKKLETQNPNDPVVAMFKPYQVEKKETLKKNARKWYRNIQKSQLPAKVKESFEMVFTQWMQERFSNLTYMEVTKMFVPLTPLEETRSYKELVAIGKKEGIKLGKKDGRKEGRKEGESLATRRTIARMIARRFNINIRRVIPRLRSLPINDVIDLGDQLFVMKTFSEAFQWIDDRKKENSQ
jgi:predicted transposase YdaD